MVKRILIDSSFIFALYDRRESMHEDAINLFSYIKGANIEFRFLIPWPILYETVNSRFVRNTSIDFNDRKLIYEKLLFHPQTIKVDDRSYREIAEERLKQFCVEDIDQHKCKSLADLIIELMIEEKEKNNIFGLLSFDVTDLRESCYKNSVNFLIDELYGNQGVLEN